MEEAAAPAEGDILSAVAAADVIHGNPLASACVEFELWSLVFGHIKRRVARLTSEAEY
jgi:hypothetical protein